MKYLLKETLCTIHDYVGMYITSDYFKEIIYHGIITYLEKYNDK